MLWVLFIITTLVAVGNFVDFLIGERGQRQIKDRLVTFYVSVAEGEVKVDEGGHERARLRNNRGAARRDHHERGRARARARGQRKPA